MLNSVCALVLLNSKTSVLPNLKHQMDTVAKGFHGRLGYHLIDLQSGEAFGYRDSERYPSASTIKTVVMVEVFKQIEEGKLKWEDQLEVPPVGKRNDSMWTAHMLEGTKINLDGLTNLMMNVSDNTATVMLAGHVGVENIEKRMLNWGFKDTACTIRAPESNLRLSRLYTSYKNMGVTSPVEMAAILKKIYDGNAASPEACEKMIRIMSSQYWDDFLDWTVPSGVTIASKVGALERSRSDSAIVFGPRPYILTVYTDNAKDRSWGFHCEGHDAIRKLGSLAWNRLNPGMPYYPKGTSEKYAPTGGGVEDS
ncbi:MAG: serine hydrolase [Fimbriimonadaceae bacterium]